MKKVKLIFQCSIIIIVFSKTVLAQSDYSSNMLDIIPPSPEASALFKFVETPVSYYDGLANTSIPLYTIQAGGIEIPISLSYHPRGIKVEEIASRVGLGWSLNFGGSISRQIRGLADDHPYGYLKNDHYATFFTSSTTRAQVYNDILNHDLDMDPDLFIFSFGSYSGKFIFDQQSGDPLLQQYDDIIIEPIYYGGLISGFTAIDEHGNIYHFGSVGDPIQGALDKEFPHNYKFVDGLTSLSSPVSEYYSSWYLTKIETYLGEEIDFEYHKESPIYWRRSYDVKEISENTASNVASYFSKINNGWQSQIETITFCERRVEFVRETIEREDLPGSYALKAIEIYNEQNQLTKKYSLSHHYQSCPGNGNELPYLKNIDPSASKRLFLDEVVEESGVNSLPPYIFEYSTVQLPNRFSNSQDLWGYYNGANNGYFLTFFEYSTSPINRRIDLAKSEAGMLKKVTYPTGGSVEFVYEHNIGIAPPELADMSYAKVFNVTTVEDGMSTLDKNQYWLGNKYEKVISFGASFTGKIQTGVSFNQSTCQGEEDPPNTLNCRFSVSLHDNNSTDFVVLFYGQGNQIILPSGSGEYTLRINPNYSHDPTDLSDSFIIKLMWDEEVVHEENLQENPNFMYAGGKRISKIIYVNDGSTVKTNEYEYLLADGSTSGMILAYPPFYSTMTQTGVGNVLFPYGSRPGSPLTSVSGNAIGYSHVQEYTTSTTSDKGKVEYEFTTFEDGGDYAEFPYCLPIDNEWLRGKVRFTKFFKKDGSSYTLIKKIENNYIYGGEVASELELNSISKFLTPLIPPGENPELFISSTNYRVPLAIFTSETLGYKTYYQMGGTADLYSTITTEYFEDGSNPIIQTVNYSYNYDDHYNLSSTETINSDGKTTNEFLYYPTEVAVASSLGYDNLTTPEFGAIGNLQTNNRIIPIQKEKIVSNDGVELSRMAQRTIFDDDNYPKALPVKVQVYNSAIGLEDRIEYHKYDDKGNPLEISKDGGPHQVFIWGYNKTYPVAKLENADYVSITLSTITNIQAKSNLDNDNCEGLTGCDEANLRNALNGLRSIPELSNAQITTYTYDPLVGMTSQTDPAGVTIYYEYDDFGRLKNVKDSDGKILNHTEYHYAE